MISLYQLQLGKDFSLPEHLCWPVSSFGCDFPECSPYFCFVDNPAEADYLYFPFYLTPLIQKMGVVVTRELLRCILPSFVTDEHRYLLFNYEDASEPLGISSVIIQVSLNRYQHDLQAIAYPYPVEDLLVDADLELEKICLHASFVGYVGSHPVRERLADTLSRMPELQMYVETTDLFHGHMEEQERIKRRATYISWLKKSLTVLCPRGAAENSVRFFETLAAGRIPVLIADTAVLPLESLIAYDDFIIRVPEADLESTASKIVGWLGNRTDTEIHLACLKARKTWERWFRVERLPELVHCELLLKNNRKPV